MATKISEISPERLAQEFAVWTACYNRNPYSSALWVSSINGFSIERYGELITREQAKDVKRIVWRQKTAQHPLNRPHYTLPRCG